VVSSVSLVGKSGGKSPHSKHGKQSSGMIVVFSKAHFVAGTDPGAGDAFACIAARASSSAHGA
jgi:hypothetical protein